MRDKERGENQSRQKHEFNLLHLFTCLVGTDFAREHAVVNALALSVEITAEIYNTLAGITIIVFSRYLFGKKARNSFEPDHPALSRIIRL
jgi:hypothetical protein